MMKKSLSIGPALLACLLAGCASTGIDPSRTFERMAACKAEALAAGKECRIGDSGVVGKVVDEHILITGVIRDSPAYGKVKKGDIVRAYQGRGVGGSLESIRRETSKRIYRLGRDWDWHLYLTVERPGARGGKGNQFTFDLIMPRPTDKQYHFGPTGFFGKIHPDYIELDHIVKGSPAAGKLQLGDRIVAVAGKPIEGDVFKLFTEAIDQAESEQGGGKLALTVERPAPSTPEDAGKPGNPTSKSEVPNLASRTSHPVSRGEAELLPITLQLTVLGTYSATTPLNCPKTDALIVKTADALIKNRAYGRLHVGLLALLATGNQEYIEHVSTVIKGAAWAKPDIEVPIAGRGYVSWYRAYYAMTLCEYYLLTGDEYVLPAIKTYANTIARGQDAAGLWNHNAANPASNFGKLHGRLPGYAAINQTSVVLWISLILAEECGVKDPEVRAAVEKTHKLYSYWIERGRLPYGNHGAQEDFFTNNGTSGSLAVAFALLNDKKGASFFSRMSAAAGKEILTGHSGPWFNILWSGIGANVSGPELTRAYNREMHWLRIVTRTWDSRFLQMIGWGCKVGDHSLGSSASTLLNLAVSRRKLRITGRDMDKSLWLDEAAARTILDAGTVDYAAQDVAGLIELLGHELPPVRIRASRMLAIKDPRITDDVMSLLADGNRNQRIGALHAISALKITSALDTLMAIVRDTKDDLWIRQLALRKLTVLDGARKHAPELLAILAGDKDYDVQGRFDEDLGSALTTLTDSDPYSAGLDRDLLYIAVNKLLDHKRQWARGAGMNLIKKIPLDELYRVADKMVYVIKDSDRTYVSYHGDSHRQTGLDILYGLNIDESLDLTVSTINEKVGRGWRGKNRKAFMKTWGSEATRVIPQIKEVLGKDADEFVKIIEAAETGRKMITLDDARKMGTE